MGDRGNKKKELPKPSGYESIEGFVSKRYTRNDGVKKRSKLLPNDQPSNVLDAPAEVPDVLAIGQVTYRRGLGRPTTLNDDITARCALLIASGIAQTVATAAMGISWNTAQDWNAKGRDDLAAGLDTVHARWWGAMLEGKASCEANWVSRVNDGARMDWKAAAWMLERRFGVRWMPAKDEPKKLEAPDVSGKTTAQLQEMLAELTSGATKLPALTADAEAPEKGAPIDVVSTSRNEGDK
jgi:hypothetical protein